jgi:hypothetical protein
MAGDLEARLLEARGEVQKSLAQRQHAIPALQRQKLLSVELYHQLAIGAALLDRKTMTGAESALDRAHTIVDTHHLIPPSPGLVRLWLLEGRRAALNEDLVTARDRWEAIVDAPAHESIPRYRGEALLRLALLETVGGRPELATDYLRRVQDGDTLRALPAGWSVWLTDVPSLASKSEHGGAALPIVTGGPPTDSQKGERARGETVRHR